MLLPLKLLFFYSGAKINKEKHSVEEVASGFVGLPALRGDILGQDRALLLEGRIGESPKQGSAKINHNGVKQHRNPAGAGLYKSDSELSISRHTV